MMYFILFVALVGVRYATKNQIVLRDQLYVIVLILLFLFSAFRYEVGCDWAGYYYQFLTQSYAPTEFALTKREVLWWLTMDQLQAFGFSYPWLNVVSSLLFFGGIYALAKRQPDPLAFVVLLFPVLIINMPMSGIRQGAAVGVICIAFLAFMDKRLIKFLILVIIASLLHSSAAVFLLLLPLVRGEYTKTRLAIAALLAIPGAFLLVGGDSGQVAVDRYINTGIDAAGAIFRIATIFITGLFYLTSVRSTWARSYRKDYKLMTIGAMIMIAVAVLLPISSVISDRLGYYLIPLQTMLFARLPYLELGRSKNLYVIAPYLGLALLFFTWVAFSNHFQFCYLPYHTWLFGFPSFSRYNF